MNANDISKNLYTNVKDTKNNCEVQIIGYSAGWVEVEHTGTMDVYKLRAKDLELITNAPRDNSPEAEEARENAPSFEDVMDKVGEKFHEEFIEGMNETSNLWEVKCPNCGYIWETTKSENYRCPKCGRIFKVRLHPDKERYVIGITATPSGRDSMDINDDVATKLRGMTVEEATDFVADALVSLGTKDCFSKKVHDEFVKFLATNDVDASSVEAMKDFLFAKYSHLNNGMHRMALGNTLRGAYKRAS
jgi:rubrerythrin